MKSPATIARFAKLPHAPLSRANICLVLLFVFQLAAAATQAQVVYSGVLSAVGSGFVEPTGMAVDAAGDVFVTDLSLTTITELPSGGGAPIAIGSGFSFPQAIAIDTSGNLYVADTHNNAVKEIVAAGGYATINTLGGGGFFQPFSVAVDAGGNVFVADTSNAQIKEIPASAQNTSTVLASGITSEGVALDSAANLYVAVRGTPAVIEITRSSGYTSVIFLGSGWVAPRGIAVDAAGNVYVTDKTAVKEIALASGLPTVFTLNSSFSGPFGLAFDRNDNLYIADLLGAKLSRLALGSAGFGAQNAGTGTAPTALSFQVAAGTTIGRINVLTQGASGMDFTGVSGSTCAAGTYSSVTACTVNVQFKPIAAGGRNGGVVFLDPSNNVLANLPVYGTGVGPQVTWQPGAQSEIYGYAISSSLAVDGSGNVFTFYHSVAGFSLVEVPAGGGLPYVLTGPFENPLGIAVDGSGNIYIADAYANQVDEVPAAYGYTTVKAVGSGFNHPYAVAVDGSGNVFVLDGNIKEIPASSGGAAVLTLGATPGDAIGLGGLAVDADGNLFVPYSVAKFQSQTQGYVEEIFRVGGYQTSKVLYSALIAPRGLAVDASENIYVADEESNLIQELLASSGYSTPLPLGSGFQQPLGTC
jgi:sugar lactone lactonase YvrE